MAECLDIAKPTTKERLDLIGELSDNLDPEGVQQFPAQDAELALPMAPCEADANTAEPGDDLDAERDRRSR